MPKSDYVTCERPPSSIIWIESFVSRDQYIKTHLNDLME